MTSELEPKVDIIIGMLWILLNNNSTIIPFSDIKKLEDLQNELVYGYGTRSHGIAITINGSDIVKYAEEAKKELRILYPEGYSFKQMVAQTGLIKLQEELPPWLDIDTSDAMDELEIDLNPDQTYIQRGKETG
jgi:hypothetical protein